MFRRLLSLACLLASLTAARAAEPDWAAILTPGDVKLPEPQENVVWLHEKHLTAAMLERNSPDDRSSSRSAACRASNAPPSTRTSLKAAPISTRF